MLEQNEVSFFFFPENSHFPPCMSKNQTNVYGLQLDFLDCLSHLQVYLSWGILKNKKKKKAQVFRAQFSLVLAV
jgi:hypothetical protein